PGRVNPESPAVQLGLRAFEKVLGTKPLLVRAGGTLPIMPALEDQGIPTVLTGFGLPESNVHSPNDKFLVRYFEAGVNTAAELADRSLELDARERALEYRTAALAREAAAVAEREANVSDVERREAALPPREADVASREDAVLLAELAVAERERAVTTAEQSL